MTSSPETTEGPPFVPAIVETPVADLSFADQVKMEAASARLHKHSENSFHSQHFANRRRGVRQLDIPV